MASGKGGSSVLSAILLSAILLSTVLLSTILSSLTSVRVAGRTSIGIAGRGFRVVGSIGGRYRGLGLRQIWGEFRYLVGRLPVIHSMSPYQCCVCYPQRGQFMCLDRAALLPLRIKIVIKIHNVKD